MKLEQVFDSGHTLACSLPPDVRHVLIVEETTYRPTGYYLVSDDEMEAAAITKVADFTKVGRRVSVQDLLAWRRLEWLPAVDHCWCEDCKAGRQMRSTLAD